LNSTFQNPLTQGYVTKQGDGNVLMEIFGWLRDFRFRVNDGKTNSVLRIPDLTEYLKPFDWGHLVCVRDRSEETLKIYFNGELIGTKADKTLRSLASPGFPLIIGNRKALNAPAQCKMDDLQILNYAMSAADVATMTAGYGDLGGKEVIAHWKFDEKGGWKAYDELNFSQGLLVNMTPNLSWIPGYEGNAIDFGQNPKNSYVKVVDNDIIDFDNTESFTISVMVKTDPISKTSEMTILKKGASGTKSSKGWNGKCYGLAFKSKQIHFGVDDKYRQSEVKADISSNYPVNEWAHVVAVRDRDEKMLSVYLNGVLVGSKEDNTNKDISSPDLPLLIGNNEYLNYHLDGQLDDVQLYNYAMSADEIKDMAGASPLKKVIPDGEIVLILPTKYSLEQNYPNPFNPETTIKFSLVKSGHTTITIYNSVGQRVETVMDRNMDAGFHNLIFNAYNYASGVYFYKIESGDFAQVRKMLLMK